MSTSFDRRVTTQLKTWLTAVGIAHEDTPAGVVVTSKNGAKVVVNSSPELTGRDLKKSLEYFSAIQTSLGYEAKMPVNRGEIPTHKAHYGDEFDLVAMRQSEFRRTPNPSTARLREYDATINQSVWKFHRMNTQVCQDHVLEIADLKQYALLWTTNYIGLYEITNDSESERKRFLSQYLGQRFYEFRKLLDKKGRNTLPTLDLAFIALRGQPFDFSNKDAWYISEDRGFDLGNEGHHDEEPERKRTHAQRVTDRKDSTAFLDQHLASMDHDQMVDVLMNAIKSDGIHDDARREAMRRLQSHAIGCVTCVGVELPKISGDAPVPINAAIKDELGNIYASAKEAAVALNVFASNVRAVLSGRYAHTGGHTFSYVKSPNVNGEVTSADALRS
jgi:hypothetical protein